VGPLTLERLPRRQDKRASRTAGAGQWRRQTRSRRFSRRMMSDALQNDFGVPTRWSRTVANTFENAAFSAEILRRAGVPSALLVTPKLGHGASPLVVSRCRLPGDPGRSSSTTAGHSERRRGPLAPAELFLPASFSRSARELPCAHELIGLGWYLCRYGGLVFKPSSRLKKKHGRNFAQCETVTRLLLRAPFIGRLRLKPRRCGVEDNHVENRSLAVDVTRVEIDHRAREARLRLSISNGC